MDDAEQSNLSSAITKVLPDLPATVLNILEETLQSLGVETTEDFHFIQEADLLSVLRPIQARKLVAAWKQTTQNTEIYSQSVRVSPASSSRSSLSPSSSPCHPVTAVDWVDSFQILWEKFPEALMQYFERGKRPSLRLRREMIRIVVSEVMKACASPSKKASTEVAKKMVATYPRSLQDVIEGDVVGAGYHSLVNSYKPE